MYFLACFFPFKYKYRITALHSTLDEKHAFASLAMLDIQYLIKEWLDTRVILSPCINYILKQSMKIVTVSVHRKWDRLVIYWLALVACSIAQIVFSVVFFSRLSCVFFAAFPAYLFFKLLLLWSIHRWNCKIFALLSEEIWLYILLIMCP